MDPLTDRAATLQIWRTRAAKRSFAHHKTADEFKSRHIQLGVPVIVFTGTVSSGVFADLQQLQQSFALKAAFLLVSLLATVLAALQTFLNFHDLSDKHKSSGAAWEAYRMRLEVALLDPAHAEMNALNQEAERLLKESPNVPKRIWDDAFDRFPTDLKETGRP